MKNADTNDHIVYDTIYMTFCNSHICSPSMFPCLYMKYTFLPHLKNSTHYPWYKPPPKYINHWFLMQLFGSFSYRNYFFRGIFPLFSLENINSSRTKILSPLYSQCLAMTKHNDQICGRISSQSMLNNVFSFLSSRFPFGQHFYNEKQFNYN